MGKFNTANWFVAVSCLFIQRRSVDDFHNDMEYRRACGGYHYHEEAGRNNMSTFDMNIGSGIVKRTGKYGSKQVLSYVLPDDSSDK